MYGTNILDLYERLLALAYVDLQWLALSLRTTTC